MIIGSLFVYDDVFIKLSDLLYLVGVYMKISSSQRIVPGY